MDSCNILLFWTNWTSTLWALQLWYRTYHCQTNLCECPYANRAQRWTHSTKNRNERKKTIAVQVNAPEREKEEEARETEKEREREWNTEANGRCNVKNGIGIVATLCTKMVYDHFQCFIAFRPMLYCQRSAFVSPVQRRYVSLSLCVCERVYAWARLCFSNDGACVRHREPIYGTQNRRLTHA